MLSRSGVQLPLDILKKLSKNNFLKALVNCMGVGESEFSPINNYT